MTLSIAAIFSVSLILFSVIDIIGSLPVIINMKKEGVQINPKVATSFAAVIMISFLFFGATILGVFGISVASFALAGALIIFLIGLEMLVGVRIFRDHHDNGGSGSVVPIAFPLLAGAGTLTTIIALKSEYDNGSIIIGIAINLLIIYIILSSTDWLSKKLSPQVMTSLRKIFGIILIAIAIQMFKDHF